MKCTKCKTETDSGVMYRAIKDNENHFLCLECRDAKVEKMRRKVEAVQPVPQPIKEPPLTSCDNDHEEIFFASHFRALCPLCAMRVRLTEEIQAVEAKLSEAEESEDQEAQQCKTYERELREAKAEINSLSEQVADLVKYKESHP